ncbi:MAG: hypothetical protein ACHQ2Z_12580 [Elusimicrobiota bacterium]
MKSIMILAVALAAIFAVSAKADDLNVDAVVKTVKTQTAVQKKAAAEQVAQLQRDRHHEDHRRPDRRRGRWEHGRNPIHGWRPAHWSRYLGYSYDMEECRAFGRAEGFPFVTRYNYSGDCYGDYRPF